MFTELNREFQIAVADEVIRIIGADHLLGERAAIKEIFWASCMGIDVTFNMNELNHE